MENKKIEKITLKNRYYLLKKNKKEKIEINQNYITNIINLDKNIFK